MPAIKLKKAAADYMAEKEREREREKAGEENRPEELPSHGGGDRPKGEVKASRAPKEPQRSFLDGDILTEKRKRFVPVADQKLDDWLSEHLESKPEVRLNFQRLFDHYKDSCQMSATPVIHFQGFCQVVRKRFGKTFALKETSMLKGLLREMKVKPKSALSGAQKLKMSDVITEALTDLESGKKGSHFLKIKQYAAAKYPVLYTKGKVLKSALQRAVHFGKVDLVRGIGYCGYYRLPGNYEDEEEDEEKKEEMGSPDEESAEGEDTKNGDGEDKEKSKNEDGEKSGEKKKKKKKASAARQITVKGNRHANPFRIEDTFPLALTFMSEPKEASVSKIRRYIMEHYPDCNVDVRLKKALERGEEHGMWQQVSGTGAGTGSYRLLIQEFNPSLHDSIDDMICSALIACSEPKQASTNSLKQYIQDYHDNFNITIKPHLLKLALERAINGGLVVRVSGIGMSGSLQLVKPFTPSPAILAGEDVDSEEEGDDSATEYVPRATKSKRGASTKSAQQKRASHSQSRPKKPARRQDGSDNDDDVEPQEYVPRKSKSRGGSASLAPARAAPKKAPKNRPASTPAKKSKTSAKASSKKKEGSKGSRQTPKSTPTKSMASPASATETSEEEVEMVEKVEYTPRKTKSRGGGSEEDNEARKSTSSSRKSTSSSRKSQGGKEASSKRPAPVLHDDGDSDEYNAPEYTPQKSRSRGGSLSKRPAPEDDGNDTSTTPKTKKQKAAASHREERAGRKR